MSGLLRIVAVTASAVSLILCAAFAPLALRGLDGFAVKQIEVIGIRHLSAEDAVTASGIDSTSNVFDDPTPWIAALMAHPLVASARIERRVPGTLVLHISESVPVAFARTPELRAIDEHGRILPADPASDDMDLPVLAIESTLTAEGTAADEQTLRITRFLGIVARQQPALLGWISEAGVQGPDVRLVLRLDGFVEVLVPPQPTATRLRELHDVMAELAAEISLVRRIDARFHGQVVVERYGRKS
jgi:cell division protein FtsQ